MPAQTLERGEARPSEKFIEFSGMLIPLDDDGHLINPDDWSEGLAVRLALQDGMELTDDHWQVIRFVRDYYLRFKTVPMPKILVKALSRTRGYEHISIRSLYALYPDAPMRRSCRYAGIPQPAGCT